MNNNDYAPILIQSSCSSHEVHTAVVLNDKKRKFEISLQVAHDKFEGELKSNAELFVAKLYANKRLPRNIVHKIINDVQRFSDRIY